MEQGEVLSSGELFQQLEGRIERGEGTYNEFQQYVTFGAELYARKTRVASEDWTKGYASLTMKFITAKDGDLDTQTEFCTGQAREYLETAKMLKFDTKEDQERGLSPTPRDKTGAQQCRLKAAGWYQIAVTILRHGAEGVASSGTSTP